MASFSTFITKAEAAVTAFEQDAADTLDKIRSATDEFFAFVKGITGSGSGGGGAAAATPAIDKGKVTALEARALAAQTQASAAFGPWAQLMLQVLLAILNGLKTA